MGQRLKGRITVVTGSGRCIGRKMALLMAEEGAKVVVNDLGVIYHDIVAVERGVFARCCDR